MSHSRSRRGPRVSRRAFVKAVAAGAVAAPHVLRSHVFGAEAPSERITLGCIGVGRMGRGDMRSFLGFKQVQVVAVCDVDAHRLADAKKTVEAHYARQSPGGSYHGCAAYGDFREVVARDDVDAVMVCTPDHWHALPAIAAARAGKDIFIQKALTLTIPEGRVLSDTVRRYGCVLQVGSQQRSDPRFRFACELVRNGRIGELKTVKVAFGQDPFTTPQAPTPPPEWLDYEMWLGPAPRVPYIEKRVHPRQGYGRPGWLRTSDYCCGMITGWGSHHMDIAHWGMGMEYGGPVEILGQADYAPEGPWDVHGAFRIEYLYPNGVTVICSDNRKNKQGVLFEGWVSVRRGRIDAEPKSLLRSTIRADEVHLYRSSNHKGNLLACIRSRAETVAPVEIGHRSGTACILGYIAMRLGRRLKWDPQRERFGHDDEANAMLTRPMRSPWRI
jgi:myo-inositol 2-dehydrogenase/D-chiro-inositol 1-dehydrogenase